MKIKRLLKYNYYKILRLRDEPKKVALSLAVGTSIMFLPFFFFGAFVAYFAAMLLNINRIAAVLTTIFWKWALVGFYVLNFSVGNFILGGNIKKDSLDQAMGFFHSFDLHQIGSAFLVGSVINAALAGILVYYIALKILEVRKARKAARYRKRILATKEE